MDQSKTRARIQQEQSRIDTAQQTTKEFPIEFSSANLDSLRKLYINQLQMIETRVWFYRVKDLRGFLFGLTCDDLLRAECGSEKAESESNKSRMAADVGF